MRTARYFNSLQKDVKKLAMTYFTKHLMDSLNARSANDIFRKLEDIRLKRPELPKLPDISTKFWHKKLRGASLDGVTMVKLESYIPGITKPLRHPLWKALSTHTLSDLEINELLDDIDNSTTRFLFQSKKNENAPNISNYTQLHCIARQLNIDALSILLIIAHKKIREHDFYMLQAIFSVSMDIILALSTSEPFDKVAGNIYRMCYEKFYKQEEALLSPHQDERFTSCILFFNKSSYPYYYTPTYYFSPEENLFEGCSERLSTLSNLAVQIGHIAESKVERTKFAYYAITIKELIFSESEVDIQRAVDAMNADRRGRPFLR